MYKTKARSNFKGTEWTQKSMLAKFVTILKTRDGRCILFGVDKIGDSTHQMNFIGLPAQPRVRWIKL